MWFEVLETTTKKSTEQCQIDNVVEETFGLLTADAITETSKAQTTVVGFAIRMNGTGWTPSALYSSLNMEFGEPIQVR